MQEKNKDLVLEAFDTLFNKRDYARAEKTIKIGQFGAPLNACRVAADPPSQPGRVPYGGGHEHICALIDEQLCCSQPDAFRAASDNCNFPL